MIRRNIRCWTSFSVSVLTRFVAALEIKKAPVLFNYKSILFRFYDQILASLLAQDILLTPPLDIIECDT